MCCPRPPETLAQAVPSCEGTTLAQEAGPGRQHQAKQHCSGCSVSTAVTMWAKLRPSVQRRLCCTTTKEKSKRHFVNEILDKKCAEMDLKSGQAANRAGGGGTRPETSSPTCRDPALLTGTCTCHQLSLRRVPRPTAFPQPTCCGSSALTGAPPHSLQTPPLSPRPSPHCSFVWSLPFLQEQSQATHLFFSFAFLP